MGSEQFPPPAHDDTRILLHLCSNSSKEEHNQVPTVTSDPAILIFLIRGWASQLLSVSDIERVTEARRARQIPRWTTNLESKILTAVKNLLNTNDPRKMALHEAAHSSFVDPLLTQRYRNTLQPDPDDATVDILLEACVYAQCLGSRILDILEDSVE